MKKLFAILLLACLLCCAGCSSDKDSAPAGNAATGQPAAESYYDEEVVAKLMSAMPAELVTRAKDTGYTLSTFVMQYVYTPADESDPARPDSYRINVSMNSPIGSTHPDNDNVDIELMREMLCAVVDSGIFDLNEEEKAALKANYYGAEDFEWELRVGNVDLSIVETPSAYNVLIDISSFDTAEPDVRYANDLLKAGYTEGWAANWDWDEFRNRD